MKLYPLLITAFALTTLIQGCGLFGGGAESVNRVKGYHVNAPNSWKTKDSANESDRAFQTSKGSIVTVTSSCQRNAAAPLEVLTKHLLFGARNIVYDKRERIVVDGSEGLYSSLRATLDGSPFRLELFVLPKNSCVFDFSLMSPRTITEEEKTEFISFFKSFNYGNN